MALRVVARYHGEEVARATARHMEYRYPDDNARPVETTSTSQGRKPSNISRSVRTIFSDASTSTLLVPSQVS